MPTAATTSIVQHEGKTLLEIRLTIEIALLGQQGVPSVTVEQKPEAHKKVDAIECGQDPEEKPAEPQAEQRHEIVIANTGMALSDH